MKEWLKNNLHIFGISAAGIYIFAVILGGLLWPGYSHVSQAISELTFRQAPNLPLMQSLFWLYNTALLVCSIGLLLRAKTKVMKASAVFLGACAFSGVMMFFFPQDPMDATLTTSGLLHLILAGIASITTLLAVSFAGACAWREDRGMGIFSWIIFGIIMISGPITAIAPTKMPEYFGIVERITIGSFIIWLLVYSVYRGKKLASTKQA